MLKDAQSIALEERFASRRVARRNQLNSISNLLQGGTVDPALIETPSRQLERARLLIQSGSPIGVSASLEGHRILEAIVGRDNRLPRSFLTVGTRTADAVCRIASLAADGSISFGTGFAIAPGLLMTNNHVLPNATAAASALAEFGLWSAPMKNPATPVSLRLNPNDLFLTDIVLDFTIVSMEPGVGNAVHEVFGSIDILPQSGKALVGEAINVIQHGDGETQSVSLRDNVVVDIFDDWLHYTSDTSPGASGSPVFNDQWQFAALHHAAFVHTGDDGRKITVNEGIRASSIARRISEMVA